LTTSAPANGDGDRATLLSCRAIAGSGAIIEFGIERPGHVRLDVFDLIGRRVAVLLDGDVEPGTHTLRWNGAPGISVGGVYICRLITGDGVRTIGVPLVR
jgi:hypothetical protein